MERQTLPDDLERLRQLHPKINHHYGEGLFHFIQNTNEQYDLVTAFLLEYLFGDATRMSAFINSISSKVRPGGGIVCVWPKGADVKDIWTNNEFEPFYDNKTGTSALFMSKVISQ